MSATAINRGGNSTLIGRTLYIPRMSIDGAEAMAAAYRSLGVNGRPVPVANDRTLEMARKYTMGEECYPEIVTLGGFLQVLESPDFDPAKTAFLMPTAGGPCRFGQYRQLFEKILREKNLPEVMVVSPTSSDGYGSIGGNAGNLLRTGWWALVCADALRKLLHQTRPYENRPGTADAIHSECLKLICDILEKKDLQGGAKLKALIRAMEQVSEKFKNLPATYHRGKLLIGVVGEIYCRLDSFSNSELLRRIEKFGGETWVASITEWVFYTNFMRKINLKYEGRYFSKEMLNAVLRNKVQQADEARLLAPLADHFLGYAEPHSIRELAENAEPYLPYRGALGEMVLNVGGAIHYYQQGADGIVDISPFTCMNGIVCEAVYPRVSEMHNRIPIRNFYFDGSERDDDRDVEMFLELAQGYRRRKKITRHYPFFFKTEN